MHQATKISLLFILLLMLSSCATTTTNIDVPGVFLQEPDAFSQGLKKYKSNSFYIKNIEFSNPGFSTGSLFFMKSGVKELRSIQTMYFSPDWIFANKIKFLIDGADVYEYTSEPNPIREVDGKYVEERNLFIVPSKLFQRILYSNSVRVRLVGSHYYVEKVDGSVIDLQ